MNRQAYYTHKHETPARVYGPHSTQSEAERHASSIVGVVTRLTGNDILRYRIKVVAPQRTLSGMQATVLAENREME